MLSEDIGKLTKLEKLWVQNNKLTALPVAIHKLNSLRELWIADNPFEFPFTQYAKTYLLYHPELIQFLKDMAMGTEIWPQVKLVTLGHGDAGKVMTEYNFFFCS